MPWISCDQIVHECVQLGSEGGGVWFVWLTIEMRDGGCDELEERGEGEKLYYIRPLNKGRERAE